MILLPPVEVHGEADIHPEAHGGPYTREGCMKEVAVHKQYTLEQVSDGNHDSVEGSLCRRRFSLRTCGLVEDPQWSNLSRTTAFRSTHVGEFHKGLSSVGGPPH